MRGLVGAGAKNDFLVGKDVVVFVVVAFEFDSDGAETETVVFHQDFRDMGTYGKFEIVLNS